MQDSAIDVDALFARYGPMVLRRCRQLLRNEDEAMDIAQDVFVQLVRHKGRLHDSYPSSLLHRIATNLSLNRIRATRRARNVPAEGLLDRIACFDNLDAPLILDRLFGRQPESTRTMAVLHYVDGMTFEQVASECGMSVSGVRKRLRGLRAALHQMEAL
jgi:RNA polymerase sigma-70 factor (ECF subfamily)